MTTTPTPAAMTPRPVRSGGHRLDRRETARCVCGSKATLNRAGVWFCQRSRATLTTIAAQRVDTL